MNRQIAIALRAAADAFENWGKDWDDSLSGYGSFLLIAALAEWEKARYKEQANTK